MTKQLEGILVALSTPFDDAGDVDEPTLRRHVDFMIDNGVHGLVPCGSTGEMAALSLDERRRVTEIVLDQNAGRAAVAPGVGANRTADAVALAKHAADHGADALLTVQPFYEPPTRAEIIEYFVTVGESAGIPLIAYNLPSVTGYNLDLGFYEELLEKTDAVRYIKDTSGDLSQGYDLIFNLGGRIKTMVGYDTLLLPAFTAGAAGAVWGAPNFIPRECVELFDLARAGKQQEAQDLFRRIWNVMNFLNVEGYTPSVKAAAELCGVPLGAPRAPYGPLPEDKLKRLAALLDAAELR